MRRLGFAMGWVLTAGAAGAQGYTPEEAAARMTVPPGFAVSLVESEPAIAQPVAIEFDDRGRLWVVQYMQYPNPEGLKRVEVDRWSRTTYDRVPEPPPYGPKGTDAITILEDTNGDGRADKRTNFVEGLNLCSGIAFGHGGVFVLQVPYLLFYPDLNGDDIPDSDPEVCLVGFGMEDAHSVANSLTWGPDGWLYGNQGSTVTANIRGIEFQQGVWRYHPRTKAFELFAEGGGNMWGLDFDETGHELSSTNWGPYLMIHAMQGAYYIKSFGKHGALHNPYAYGYFDHVTHHDPAGGHVTVGGMIYQGDSFPPEYRGKYIGMNLLTHNMYWAEMIPKGATFESRNLGELMNSNDSWFAPSDMTMGPDGALYIADWHDKRTAHPDPDAEWDRSNGRIYRMAYDGTAPIAAMNLHDRTSEELADLLEHDNVWFRRRARVILAERRDGSILPRLREQIAGANPRLALESFWALYVSGGFDDATPAALLEHENPAIRRWAVRFIGDERRATESLADRLREMAAADPDVHVRAQLASTAKRLPAPEGLAIAAALTARDEDAADPAIPLLTWWAVETHAMNAIDETLARFATDAQWATAMGAETILPRLIRRYAADGSEAGDRACIALLDGAEGERAAILLASLESGLQERGQSIGGVAGGGLFGAFAEADAPVEEESAEAPPVHPDLAAALLARYRAAPDDGLLSRLAVRLGDEQAYAAVKAQAFTGETDRRIEALKILARFGKDDCIAPLSAAVAVDGDAALRLAALDALRRYRDPAIADTLLAVYAGAGETMRTRLRDALFSKPEWTAAFLAAVEAGAVPTDDVPLTQLRVIAHHEDDALNELVEKHWGRIRAGTPEEKLAEMRRLNNELRAAKGDPVLGKKVFADNCLKCHQLFGEGGTIGPDLTQANRLDREYMLVSLVDPSFMVRKEYQQVIVRTVDGEILNGVMAASPPGTITLFNANAEATTLPNDQVEEIRESPLSLMPEGLVTTLPGDDIRNLFAYIEQNAAEH